MRATFLAAAAVLLAANSAHAGGYHIDEQDARATGRAGAVTANPWNASAIYYNPGAVGTSSGLDVEIGGSLVAPTAKYIAPGGAETSADNQVHILPQAYVTYRLSDLVGVGAGFYTPFGLALRWPATSPGRANVRDIELRSYFLSAVGAINLSSWVPGLAIGAGIDLVPASVRLERDIPFGTDIANVALSGAAFGVGAHAGVVYQPQSLPVWFGVTYRSPVKLNISGDANFSADPALRPALPPDGEAKTSVTLPQTLDFGVAVHLIPEWELEADFDWTGWSTFDELRLELPGNTVSVTPKNWRNTYTLRLGTEVAVSSMWSVRGGLYWDQTPVPPTTLDFQLPDGNRVGIFAGVGAAIVPLFRVDAGALVIPTTSQTTAPDPNMPPIKGTFEASAWVVGLSLGFKLDSSGRAAQ